MNSQDSDQDRNQWARYCSMPAEPAVEIADATPQVSPDWRMP